jgi:hypothetical protein
MTHGAEAWMWIRCCPSNNQVTLIKIIRTEDHLVLAGLGFARARETQISSAGRKPAASRNAQQIIVQ